MFVCGVRQKDGKGYSVLTIYKSILKRSFQFYLLKPVILQAAHGNAGLRYPKNCKNKIIFPPGSWRFSRLIAEGRKVTSDRTRERVNFKGCFVD